MTDLRQQITGDIDRLWNELHRLAEIDDIFWQTQAVIRANPNLSDGGAFQDWIASCYVATVTAGIRRVCDNGKGVLSLSKVLGALSKNCTTLLSRAEYTALYPGHSSPLANGHFDRYGGKGQSHIPRRIVAEQQKRLATAVQHVAKYANENVAHLARTPSEATATFGDVRDCLAEIVAVARWCRLVVTAVYSVGVVPVEQTSPWHNVFRFAWLPSNCDVPDYDHLHDRITPLLSGPPS